MKRQIDLLNAKGGEGREDLKKSLSWMFGTEMYVTCGDLILINELTQYQKSAEP